MVIEPDLQFVLVRPEKSDNGVSVLVAILMRKAIGNCELPVTTKLRFNLIKIDPICDKKSWKVGDGI